MRILHVSEAMGGGITSAVIAMVEATPEFDHHLLMRPRAAHDTGAVLAEHFSSVHALSRNPIQALRQLRHLNIELFPDIIHAHSSFGGVLIRVASLDRARIVYSPHCFAFERRDLSWSRRNVFRLVERILAPRTDLLLAVAPNEVELAAELGHHVIAYAPNRTMQLTSAVANFRRPMTIVVVGRVCRQKDWRYLVHLKKYVDQQFDLDASWVWLGGGDEEGEQTLRDAGVIVTGWISREALIRRMASAQVYVHTAAWEAAPISILEAAQMGLPLVLRSIPPLDSLELPGREPHVVGMARRLVALDEPGAWAAAQRASLEVSSRHSKSSQGTSLREAYALVTGKKLERDVPVSAADWEDFVATLGPSITGRGIHPESARSAAMLDQHIESVQ